MTRHFLTVFLCTGCLKELPEPRDTATADSSVVDTATDSHTGETGDSDTDTAPLTDVDGDGYIASTDGGDDCDDSDATVHPDASESCNGVDDDCDDSVDEGVMETYYADTDGDTYGDPATSTTACGAPSGYVANSADCDDGKDLVHPGAEEICDGIDDNCDGVTDEGAPQWYPDMDADTFGDGNFPIGSCNKPTGYVSNSDDCDDADAAVYPNAIEVCNNVDDDCDGSTDERVANAYHRDVDGDSYGDPLSVSYACTVPSGYVADWSDCDDSDAGINPGEAEIVGNGVDDDCSGTETVFSTDFGIASGSCVTDGFVLSDGTSVRQAGGCYLWVEGGGSLAAPVVSDDVPISGLLTAGETYTFTWNVGNAFTPSTQFVGAIDGGSVGSVSVTAGASSTLALDVTVGSSSVTASIWHTGTGAFDGYLTGFTVEH